MVQVPLWFANAMQREPVVMWSVAIGAVGARPSFPLRLRYKETQRL